MQQYSHDYTKVAETQNVLFLALEDLRNDHTYEAKRGIMKARELLQQYLAQDNMVPDDDVYDGWVRASEAQRELESQCRSERHPLRLVSDGSPVGAASSLPAPRVERHGQIDSRYLTQQTDGADPGNPLYGKVAVLSGTFEQIGMERDEVAAAIQRLGAKLNRSVSRTMQVFVMGNRVGPSKLAEVEQFRAEGHDIRILSQLEFKEIVNQYMI